MKSLDDHGLGHIVVICEDRFEGTRLGPVISDINPPAAQGGPFGKVKDDDVIRIDIESRRIDVLSQASKNDQDGQNKTKQGPIKNKFAPTEKYAAILAAKS